MKRLTEIFTLSKSEQRVIVIVVLALVVVAQVRHHRSARQLPLRPKPAATVKPSPDPHDLRDEQ